MKMYTSQPITASVFVKHKYPYAYLVLQLGPQNVRNFSYPVRIRWIKSSNFASFIYIAGYLNVRKMSEMLVFRTFVGALQILADTL